MSEDINVGAISEALNNKVDLNSSWSTPSSRYIDLTLGASGTNYTAPANGWFSFDIATNTTGNVYGHLKNVENPKFSISSFNNNGWEVQGFLPVKKGDIIYYGYIIQGTLVSHKLTFTYAQDTN